MIAAEQLRTEDRQEAAIEPIKGLMALGMKAADIAKAFGLPEQTVQEIIRQIKRREA